MLLQALHVEIEMKNINFQVTLLVQKVWERRSRAFSPHCIPGDNEIQTCIYAHDRRKDIFQGGANIGFSRGRTTFVTKNLHENVKLQNAPLPLSTPMYTRL